MSTLIGEARARLLGYSDGKGQSTAPGTANPTTSGAVLPPLDEVDIRVELDTYADPFAPGNEGGFDLVWDRLEPVKPGTSEPERLGRLPGVPVADSPRAVGRLWTSFSRSDAAILVLGQLAG